jgi:hypothetical protein
MQGSKNVGTPPGPINLKSLKSLDVPSAKLQVKRFFRPSLANSDFRNFPPSGRLGDKEAVKDKPYRFFLAS